MLDLIRTDFAKEQRTAVMQYCKLENVVPATVVRVSRPGEALKLRVETMTFHLLLHIDKQLKVMISRLTAVMEHSRVAQGRLS